MTTWRTTTLAAAALAAPLVALTTTGPATTGLSVQDTVPAAAGTAPDGTATFSDARGDVAKRKLDIRKVTVRNDADSVTVRVHLPGVRKVYDYPLGYVSVWLDTDPTQAGPEYGHFMQFWSDYRFAETRGWREAPTRAWGHSPEGRCVSDAGLRGDMAHKLRWFEYVVSKREGCFEADAVRVAVTTVNEGDHHPVVDYRRDHVDHLGGRHTGTAWVPQA